MNIAITSATALVIAASASASATLIDFSTDDSGNAIVNGQQIDAEFFTDFSISSPSGDALAAFDTTPGNGGPNAGGGDTDLLVGLGNALIIQNDSFLSQNLTPGVFDTADDDAGGGEVLFSFNTPVELLSITLIDINGNAQTDVILTDSNGLTRTYDVPSKWTNDIDVAPNGFATLDLTSLLDQDAEGSGGPATATQDLGFNAADVVSLSVEFSGSGALDNVRFIPSPASAALAGLAGLAALRRRRA